MRKGGHEGLDLYLYYLLTDGGDGDVGGDVDGDDDDDCIDGSADVRVAAGAQ